MNARDELTIAIAQANTKIYGTEFKPAVHDFQLADELLCAGWAKPRTVTSLNGLAALEVETIIRDVDGHPKEKQSGPSGEYWAAPGDRRKYDVHEIWLPVVVLWEPTP